MKDPTEQVIEIANKYLERVVDAPLRDIGGILSDTVNYWRYKNRVNLLLKTKEFLERKGIDPQKALPDTIVPLLDAAGDTSDPTLQGMFAALLAAHLSPDGEGAVHPSYVKVVSQLAPLDAFLLMRMYKILKDEGADYRTHGWSLRKACEQKGTPREVMILTFQNIWRLGICDHGSSIQHLNRAEQLILTPYGWDLLSKCTLGLTD